MVMNKKEEEEKKIIASGQLGAEKTDLETYEANVERTKQKVKKAVAGGSKAVAFPAISIGKQAYGAIKNYSAGAQDRFSRGEARITDAPAAAAEAIKEKYLGIDPVRNEGVEENKIFPSIAAQSEPETDSAGEPSQQTMVEVGASPNVVANTQEGPADTAANQQNIPTTGGAVRTTPARTPVSYKDGNYTYGEKGNSITVHGQPKVGNVDPNQIGTTTNRDPNSPNYGLAIGGVSREAGANFLNRKFAPPPNRTIAGTGGAIRQGAGGGIPTLESINAMPSKTLADVRARNIAIGTYKAGQAEQEQTAGINLGADKFAAEQSNQASGDARADAQLASQEASRLSQTGINEAERQDVVQLRSLKQQYAAEPDPVRKKSLLAQIESYSTGQSQEKPVYKTIKVPTGEIDPYSKQPVFMDQLVTIENGVAKNVPHEGQQGEVKNKANFIQRAMAEAGMTREQAEAYAVKNNIQ